jgi:hypothetical protein
MKNPFFGSRILLIAAFLLVAGLFLAGQVFERIYEGKKQSYVNHPAGFEFKNHTRVDGQKTFTVEGELINTRDAEWRDVELVVRIYAGKAYMTYCVNHLDHIGKRSSRDFRIVCRYTEGRNLPDNINYELSVARATRD